MFVAEDSKLTEKTVPNNSSHTQVPTSKTMAESFTAPKGGTGEWKPGDTVENLKKCKALLPGGEDVHEVPSTL